MPSIWPEYSGERSSAPRMMSWVRSLVWVIQHDTWRGWSACEPMNENTGRGSSPGCSVIRSEEHTSELQSLMRISYAVFCLKKKNTKTNNPPQVHQQQRAS